MCSLFSVADAFHGIKVSVYYIYIISATVDTIINWELLPSPPSLSMASAFFFFFKHLKSELQEVVNQVNVFWKEKKELGKY